MNGRNIHLYNYLKNYFIISFICVLWKTYFSSEKSKKIVKRVSLLSALLIYTSVGALFFQLLEYDNDVLHIKSSRDLLLTHRNRYVNNTLQRMEDISCQNETYRAEVMKELKTYEYALENGISQGLSVSMVYLDEEQLTPRWEYVQCVFFAATVLTTIGYGNIAPSTKKGKVYCIIFALIGIPVTLSVIAEMGDALASLLPENTLKGFLPRKVQQGSWMKLISIIGTLSILLLFIALGGTLFQFFEDWTFLDSFYFCFITTTTIGFGDLVPATASLVICGLYILIGLALTSTVIELLRRQYAAYWDQMKHFSLRLQELSSPLAEAMRKMAETGSGEIAIDLDVLKELQNINQQLQQIQQNSIEADDPWEALVNIAEKKKVIQIFMYESSM